MVRRVAALRHDGAARVLLVEAVSALRRQHTLVHVGRVRVDVVERVTVTSRLTLRRILHLLIGHHLLRASRSPLEAQVAILVR